MHRSPGSKSKEPAQPEPDEPPGPDESPESDPAADSDEPQEVDPEKGVTAEEARELSQALLEEPMVPETSGYILASFIRTGTAEHCLLIRRRFWGR